MGGNHDYSDHFKHATTCAIFACIGVETVIYEYIWIRRKFQAIFGVYPSEFKHPRDMNNRFELLEFLKSTSTLPEHLLTDIDELFILRNSIVHPKPRPLPPWSISFEDAEKIQNMGKENSLDSAVDQKLASDGDQSLQDLAKEFGSAQAGLSFQGLESYLVNNAAKCLSTARQSLVILRSEVSM